MNRIKIVATIGPVTANAESLQALAAAGMSVARLNGSHADLQWHADTIALIRQAVPGIPILLDIPGRKIRTVQLAHEPKFTAGEVIVLTTEPGHDGHEKVSVGSDTLHEDLFEGAEILADDGTLRFTVVKLDGRDIHCRAETPGRLRSRKGINVPAARLSGDLVTDKDRAMMDFASDHGVDYVGISFVESAQHVMAIRALAGGPRPGIVAKVENQAGLDNMDKVIAAADAIMIDRGDLSVETGLETLALAQKRILASATDYAKPVIVATEMLHTMIDNDAPTKAEVSDITNAVLDGCGATMLSGETAIGAHPVKAVAVMRRIVEETDAHIQEDLDRKRRWAAMTATIPEAMGEAIALICRGLPITKIIALTRGGFAARMISARRPRQPILAVSDDAEAARAFNLLPGVTGIPVDIPFTRHSMDFMNPCLEHLWRQGLITDDDMILITAVSYPRSGNRMNMVETHRVSDLREVFGWAR